MGWPSAAGRCPTRRRSRGSFPKGCDFLAYFIVGVEPPDPSERVNVYLPKSLIGPVDRRAAELGISRSSFFGLAASIRPLLAIRAAFEPAFSLFARRSTRQARPASRKEIGQEAAVTRSFSRDELALRSRDSCLRPSHGARPFASVDRADASLHSAAESMRPRCNRPLPGGNADDRYDGSRRDSRRRPRAVQCSAARRGAGADRREHRRDLRHWLDRRGFHRTQHVVRDIAADSLRGRNGRRHPPHRMGVAHLWPPRRLPDRLRLRCDLRSARRRRHHPEIVSAVLPRDLLRRALRLGVAILPLRRRRPRQRSLSPESNLMGACWRRVRGRARPAACAVDDGLLGAALFAASFVVQAVVALVAIGCCPPYTHRARLRRIFTAAARCLRSSASATSSPLHCAAPSPTP